MIRIDFQLIGEKFSSVLFVKIIIYIDQFEINTFAIFIILIDFKLINEDVINFENTID